MLERGPQLSVQARLDRGAESLLITTLEAIAAGDEIGVTLTPLPEKGKRVFTITVFFVSDAAMERFLGSRFVRYGAKHRGAFFLDRLKVPHTQMKEIPAWEEAMQILVTRHEGVMRLRNTPQAGMEAALCFPTREKKNEFVNCRFADQFQDHGIFDIRSMPFDVPEQFPYHVGVATDVLAKSPALAQEILLLPRESSIRFELVFAAAGEEAAKHFTDSVNKLGRDYLKPEHGTYDPEKARANVVQRGFAAMVKANRRQP